MSAAVMRTERDAAALAAPCGEFWLTQLEVGINGNVTGESDPGPAADLPSSRPGGGQPVNPCDPPGPDPGDGLRRYSFVVHFHHRDHLGSLRVVTGEAGLEESATDWYPFGLEMVPDGQEALSVSRKKYTGHERDEETGLDYMFARYKAARFGFFLSPDPVDDVDISVPISWNKYAYVRMNPLTLWDPSGLTKKSTCTDKNHDGKDDNTGKACGGNSSTANKSDVSCGINRNGSFECRTTSTPPSIPIFGALVPDSPVIIFPNFGFRNIYVEGFLQLGLAGFDYSSLPDINLGGGPLDTVRNRVRSRREFSLCIPVSGDRALWNRTNQLLWDYTRVGRTIGAVASAGLTGTGTGAVGAGIGRLIGRSAGGGFGIGLGLTMLYAGVREWTREMQPTIGPGYTLEFHFVQSTRQGVGYEVFPEAHPDQVYEGENGECP